jgi:hypothetical protein
MSTTQKVHRLRLGELLSSSHGRYLTVTFVKVNGDVRVLTGRFGVHKDLKGGINRATTWDKPYKCIWDNRKKAYRTISLLTMLSVHMRGVHYEVID